MGSEPHLRVAIIGAGFAGVGMAIGLLREGVEDFVVLERAGAIGGIWRDNTYPGCACDVPSRVYQYSFEPNPAWTRGYASQPEILAYLRRCAEKYGVTGRVRTSHDVLRAEWDEAYGRWAIETSRGRFTADVLVNAGGLLSEPKPPAIPGFDAFSGTVFHSARWNHDHDLAGRSVAVIGTGASAIQFVPAIQPRVDRLRVFQRTAPWVMPRNDRAITRLERRLLARLPVVPKAVRAGVYWALESRVLAFRRPALMRLAALVARLHMRRQVPDPALRRKLLPDYVMGCKRILLSNDYYPALTQPNVDVVPDPIVEVRERSIVTADGTEHEVDTIVLGTGFEITRPPIARRIHGRDGRPLSDHWSPSMLAYRGTTVPGFPNFVVMTGPNTGTGHSSVIFIVESQVAYVLDCLRTMRARGARRFEVRREAFERFNHDVQSQLEGTVWTAGHCHSWYMDDTGRNTTLWPGFTWDYRRQTRRFDAEAYDLAA